MKVKLVRVTKRRIPPLDIGDSVQRTVGEIAADSIVENVEMGRTADGAPLKRNAPSTIRKKLGNKPLIGKNGRLLRDLKVTVDGQNVDVEPGTDEIKRIIGYVAQQGYVGWFAINEKARQAILKILHKRTATLMKGRK